jgi:phosphatidylserine/phosphatidylglycerophosphate/cardiolipin synthase-like enzyme
MIEQQRVRHEDWWVPGDAPARLTPRAAFLIDGRLTMLEMCARFLGAKRSIYITAWGITPDLLLVRGKHHRAGLDGSPEQEELLRWLGSKGLEDDDLRFWQQSKALSVANVLSYAVGKGVDVRILLWETYTLLFPANAQEAQSAFEPLGVRCLLDDSHMGLFNHPTTALHQKTVVVDNRFAFVGGVDMMIEGNGEYDRWDSKSHLFNNPLRINNAGISSHGWHDVHTVFEGQAVYDVERNFCQRWNAVVQRHKMDEGLLLELPELADSVQGKTEHESREVGDELYLQVTRTVPDRIYDFAPDGIATILASYLCAIQNAQRFIYIENQYFWRRTFLGLENSALGIPHADMEQLIAALADAIARGVIVTFLLPDNPNVGREFTDDGLHYLWEQCAEAVKLGSLSAYTLGTSFQKEGEERRYYRPIYVHGKVAIVDDAWITVGSANLNNRGMRDDAEMNVSITHPRMAKALRMLLMAEHLGLSDEDTLFRIIEVIGQVRLTGELEKLSGNFARQWAKVQRRLNDPHTAIGMYAQRARLNLRAIKKGQPLKGHLLPYIPHDRAKQYGVELSAVNGWLDTLPEPQAQTEVIEATEIIERERRENQEQPA